MTILSTFGGTSGVDTGDIPASLRFRSAASAYLSRTPGSAGNRKTWTWSGWVKRGALGSTQIIFQAGADGNNFLYGCYFNSSDKLVFSDGAQGGGSICARTTDAVFRDPTSWLHIVVQFNAAATSAKIYVDGVEQTATGTQPANVDYSISNTVEHRIGRAWGVNTSYLDGYLSRICFVDGTALTPDSFGYLNTEINEWVSKSQSAVKAVVDAGGTNSFMLDFDDATSLTTLGYDKSSKGNNWTLNNFSLTAGTSYDRMLDVPGNSFATLNPLDALGTLTLSEGNIKGTQAAASHQNRKGSMALPTSGKWYWELESGSTTGASSIVSYGLAKTIAALNAQGGSTGIFCMQNDANHDIFNETTNVLSTGSTVAAGVIRQVAYDADSGKLWFGEANVFASSTDLTSGNPSAGTNPCMTLAAGEYFPYMCCYANSFWQNFGQAPLHASATYHSAAGGYFRYAPPTGFKALCQRNLPDPAILNPENGFVSVIATEDNIYSTLAAARSGWTDYVDILKNRAASESWAWQFSHDSSNEYAVAASSLVRQAKRTQSGSDNWVGYSIRVGAACGTAAGSVSHTNGAATTITHNVGVSARQLILLFNRAGGSAVPVYHPDLTSGELLDLCTTAADAASTAITSVGTNSFQIGSGVATGTYDYLVCSEISQFFDLGKWTGNASADGAYFDAGHKPKMLYAKALSTTDDHRVYDELRPGYNVQGGVVLANTNAAETTTAEMDITAFGMKARIATAPNAAQTYVTASWASVASKYSLAR